MANIASGAGAGELLTVGETSKAAYAELRDTSGNVITTAHKAAVLATQGTMPMSGLDDDTVRLMRVDRYGNVRSGSDTLMFWEGSGGASLNTQRWTSTATTMTATQTAANGILLNASAITTINTGVLLTSARTFPKYPRMPLRISARIRYTTVSNQTWDFGIAQQNTLSATTSQIDNGVFWKFSGSTIRPTIANAGTDIVAGSDVIGLLNTTDYLQYDIVMDDDRATFTIQDSDTGAILTEQTLRVPAANAKIGAVTHYNALIRVRNGGSAPASAGQLFMSECQIVAIDASTNKPWQHQLSGMNLSQEIIPTTFAQTHQMANAAWPTNAVLGAGAASYTTLGGLYSIAAVASAVTDFPLFAYQIPAPYTFFCTGIHIEMVNTGAANAATPATTYLWALDNGSVASLSAGTHIKYPIGMTSIPAGSAIGAISDGREIEFNVPIMFQPGRFLDIVLRIVGGAATASQVIQGHVSVKGYFQ